MKYADRVYKVSDFIDVVSDSRKKPQIKTSTTIKSALVMALAQMGSLNALEETASFPFWKKWIEGEIPSADTVGRVFSQTDCNGIRKTIKHVYDRLKRNKALKSPSSSGLFSLIVDGHENNNSYLRRFEGSLERTMHTSRGDRIQYYHKNVTAVLLCKDFVFLLDAELQKPGEDEVAVATRLVERVIMNFPRAFDLIIADGLYARAPFFKMAQSHKKDVIAVLKDDRRELFKDAVGLFETMEPQVTVREGKSVKECWDLENFTTWEQLGKEVRVVRSLETTVVLRQKDGKEEEMLSDWIWVTTIPQTKVSTEGIVNFGHSRWAIENNCFNELGNKWNANHVYKNNANAIIGFWLMTMLAYNLFHAFFLLDLKPELREKHLRECWMKIIAAELYNCFTAPP